MRVRDQLVYLGELCGRRRHDVSQNVDTWLERLGLADRARDRLDALSHGSQQRVQLIGALVNEPELLVLDEPFSGLDPLAMGSMAGLLAELTTAGATVLFSSHQLDLVEDLCDRLRNDLRTQALYVTRAEAVQQDLNLPALCQVGSWAVGEFGDLLINTQVDEVPIAVCLPGSVNSLLMLVGV